MGSANTKEEVPPPPPAAAPPLTPLGGRRALEDTLPDTAARSAAVEAHAESNDIRTLNVFNAGAKKAWELLSQALSDVGTDGFVALDVEFSGLNVDIGKDMEKNYAALKKWAESRAVCGLGVSVFDPDADADDGDPDSACATADEMENGLQGGGGNGVACDAKAGGRSPPAKYRVTTFNFVLMCQGEFTMTADSAAFLTSHGFDFNKMFRHGIKYHPAWVVKKGENPAEAGAFRWGPWPRGLLYRLGRAGVPIVTHNGWLDLGILYAAFHGPLPSTLTAFIGKLLDCAPVGYYDTKLLEASGGETAPCLAVSHAWAVRSGGVRVQNRKNLPPDSFFDPTYPTRERVNALCPVYAVVGSCFMGRSCQMMHDPFEVVRQKVKGALPKDLKAATKLHKKLLKQGGDEEGVQSPGEKKAPRLNKKARARLVEEEKEKARQLGGIGNFNPEADEVEARTVGGKGQAGDEKTNNGGNKAHMAGFDAFMTGYVFAAHKRKMGDAGMNALHNRIKVGKNGRLALLRSQFKDPACKE